MKIISTVVESRPDDVKPDLAFTDSVMNRVESKKGTEGSLWRAITLKPAFMILLAVALVGLVSGVSYAVVSLLWGDSSVTVEVDNSKASDRQSLSVYADNCGWVDSKRSFEVRRGHSMSDEELKRVAQADCEYGEMFQWAKSYFHEDTSLAMNNTPGYEYSTVRILPLWPSEVQQINDATITIDGTDYTVGQDAKIVINRQDSTYGKLQPGDVVSVVQRYMTSYRNRDDCNSIHCTGEILSEKSEIVAVVKFNFTLEDFNKRDYLLKIAPCLGNETELCHGETGGMEVFTRKFEINGLSIENGQNAWIEGRIDNMLEGSFTITTSSGRSILISGLSDTVNRFNRSEPAVQNNTQLAEGDTVSIWYKLTGDQSERIDLSDIYNIVLLLEVANRVDPLVKY